MMEGSGYVRLKDADAAPDPEGPTNYAPEHCQYNRVSIGTFGRKRFHVP